MAKYDPHHKAIEAIDKACGVLYARPETAHNAITAILGLVGARRLHAAVGFDSQAAGDRRLLSMLARVEDTTVRLYGIPVRVEQAAARKETWAEICRGLTDIRELLTREQAVADVVERQRTG